MSNTGYYFTETEDPLEFQDIHYSPWAALDNSFGPIIHVVTAESCGVTKIKSGSIVNIMNSFNHWCARKAMKVWTPPDSVIAYFDIEDPNLRDAALRDLKKHYNVDNDSQMWNRPIDLAKQTMYWAMSQLPSSAVANNLVRALGYDSPTRKEMENRVSNKIIELLGDKNQYTRGYSKSIHYPHGLPTAETPYDALEKQVGLYLHRVEVDKQGLTTVRSKCIKDSLKYFYRSIIGSLWEIAHADTDDYAFLNKMVYINHPSEEMKKELKSKRRKLETNANVSIEATRTLYDNIFLAVYTATMYPTLAKDVIRYVQTARDKSTHVYEDKMDKPIEYFFNKHMSSIFDV